MKARGDRVQRMKIPSSCHAIGPRSRSCWPSPGSSGRSCASLGLDTRRRCSSPAIAFTPYVAATAWIPVVAALLLRQRAVAVVALVAAVVLVVAVAPRAFDGPRVAVASGPALSVLTANLRYGNGDPAALMALARRSDADLVSLQELPPDEAERIDAAGARRAVPVPRARHAARCAGQRAPLALPADRPRTAARASRMAMPEATLRVPGAPPVRVKAVHPVAPLHGDVAVWEETMRSLPRATPRGELRMLVGDFNATLDHHELRDLIGSGYVDAGDATGHRSAGHVPRAPAPADHDRPRARRPSVRG